MDVNFITFGNVALELLQYRDADVAPESEGNHAYPAEHPYSSPAFVNNMHLSFWLGDDVDPDQFATQLEEASHAAGLTQVRCNRVVPVGSEDERKNVPSSANSFKITEGGFEGWTLFYVKGPDGEQLEFNQVRGAAKRAFDKADSTFNRAAS